jgi:hypothetical protein
MQTRDVANLPVSRKFSMMSMTSPASRRGLYHPNDMIEDIQVDTGALPETAHTGYWHQKKVFDETAALTLKWALNPVPDEVLA